jgi:hypothetical protein
VTARDFNNRIQGVSSTLKSKFTPKPDDDVVIVDRVRSKLGRVVSHPHAIHVTSSAGNVTLSGPILENEVDELLTCVKRVHGVNEVTNDLEVHKQAGNHPSLQGGSVPQGSQFEFFQENWSPAARVVAGTAGAALALIGGSRKNVLGAGLSAAGLLLLARGITNKGLKEFAGWDDEKTDDDGQQFNNRTVRTDDAFVPRGVGM